MGAHGLCLLLTQVLPLSSKDGFAQEWWGACPVACWTAQPQAVCAWTPPCGKWGEKNYFWGPSCIMCEIHTNTWTFVSSLTSLALFLLCSEEVHSFFHSSDSCVIEGLNACYLSVAFSSCQSNLSGWGFVLFLCCCDYAGCSISP